MIGAAAGDSGRRGAILRAMSLPPGFLDELRQRITLGRVVGRKVAWDLKKSNQAKGDLWAPCPFHQEKSASFHVDDRKGFYYCFGCHAKGDAVSFVRETENVGFMEAVEILAREAGMPMPAQDPRPPSGPRARTRLAEVMEMAVQHYRLALARKEAAEARAYLARRGLAERGAGALGDRLGRRGPPRPVARADGEGRDGGPAARGGADGRGAGRRTTTASGAAIIFPIRDARGRAIALGGRSLDPEARAKYLNSPQTPLFDKGRTPVQPRPGARGGRQGRAARRGRGLHGRDRAGRGGLRRAPWRRSAPPSPRTSSRSCGASTTSR